MDGLRRRRLLGAQLPDGGRRRRVARARAGEDGVLRVERMEARRVDRVRFSPTNLPEEAKDAD